MWAGGLIVQRSAYTDAFLNPVQVTEWGADGIIVGSALVKALGEASSPKEGLEALRTLARSIKKGSKKLLHAA